MLNKIIEFSVKSKFIIGLFTIALVCFGIYETTKLPIDAVPDITNNQVQVITVAPSYGATDIERLVTFPIEQANSNIRGLKEIRSFSRFGLSVVTIVFDDDTDVYWARQQVAERLQKVQTEIPKGIGNPELGPISTGLGEIYQYVVRPKKGYEKKYDETELRTIQDWIVRRQLVGVKGVAEVSSFGGKLKQYEISINTNKLQSYGLTIADVFRVVEKNNQNTGGAYIEKGATSLFIRTEGLIGTIEDIQNISLNATASGIPLFIRDVADVKIGHATRYGAVCYNDTGEVTGAIVMMLKGANSSEVIKNVKDRIAKIQKTLPEGIILEPFLDRTKMVNNAIGTVEKNLLEGALIVIFVLVLFLGNFRAGLLVASVIPLAMLFAVIMMNLFGVSGNLMSLGALDFGLIVDGAVIIVEAVMHQLSHSKKFKKTTLLSQKVMDEEVCHSASKMMNSAVFGQIIILIVYLPILTLQGIEGKMFKPMAQTVAFALLGAFLISLTYIPMMSSLFLSKKVKHEPNFSDRLMFKVEEKYQHWLQIVLNHPKKVLSTVLLLFIIAISILLSLGGEFIPVLEEGDFAVETRVLTGSSLNTTIESTQKVAHILKTRFPEVEKVVTKIGSGEVPTDPMPMEAADVMIILKDRSEWTSAETFKELSEKMSEAISEVPGVTTSFQYPVQMRFNELMTGAKQEVVCKIFGENLDTLSVYAQKLGKLVNGVKGTQNLFIEPVAGIPQIVIEYNRPAIAQYHLNIEEINNTVNSAFAGQSTGLVFEGEKRFDLVVRLENNQRENIEDVKNLLISTPFGTQIPLYQLATVSLKNSPNQIQREDAKRRIVVGFNTKDRDVQSIVTDLQKKAENEIKLPAGYYITYGGSFENLEAAKQRLAIAVPISLLLIFVLLFFAFNSFKQGLIIYSAIPLSAIGGIFFLALRDMPFSISAGIGFIALFGVAVLNGIVLISEFNQLKSEGLTDLRRIVLMGTKVRLRPVLMTAFVASLGFLPMAISTSAGSEVQRPLATVVIGGLMIATLLTLFVLPILYITFEKEIKMDFFKSKKTRITVLLLFVSVTATQAQTSISLQNAIDVAVKNNITLKNENLKAEYQKKLINTATNIPATNLNSTFGQYNSSYSDNQFGISQSFNFPTIYSRQKSLYTEEWNLSKFQVNLKRAELTKEVTKVFYSLLYLEEKEKLLMKSDTIFANFLQKSELRFLKGESNILEKTTAETQRGDIKLQLIQLREEQEILKSRFRLLLNSETDYKPSESKLKLILDETVDSTLVNQHPSMQFLEQQMKVSKSVTQLEKSKKLPSLTFGYSNTSITGMGADDIVYDRSTRFHSAQFGLDIPLLGGTHKNRIGASKLMETIAENEYTREKNTLQREFQNYLSLYKSNLEKMAYFEKTALPNSKIIIDTANKQFYNGEINYLEWVMLMNRSIAISGDYIDVLKNYNDTVIHLNYLTSKP